MCVCVLVHARVCFRKSFNKITREAGIVSFPREMKLVQCSVKSVF